MDLNDKLKEYVETTSVSMEDVLDVLQGKELDLQELLLTGVTIAKSKRPIAPEIMGEIIAKLAHRLIDMEERMKRSGAPSTVTAPPSRFPPKATVPVPEGVTVPNCPGCGKRMILRANRATGSRFFGCQDYPACKKSIPYDEAK